MRLGNNLRNFSFHTWTHFFPLLPTVDLWVDLLVVKNPPAMQKTWVWSLGWEDPLEEGMATLSSILAWRIPWTEEPGQLQSMWSQRVGHDWSDRACMRAWKVNLTMCALCFRHIFSHSGLCLSSCVLHGTKLLIYVCGWQKGGPTNIVAHNVGLVSLSCLTLCNPMDCSPPGSSVHGILQARKLDWVAVLSSRGSFRPRDQIHVSYISC